ncbi:DUF4436 family protein [Kutzneria albida]|uniref:DUF4436 domain-containing protein n=1 Tax=Kutzneria albida DSM 43870 TaxID=1449976 RepID=W5W4A1_9PSEU|nr:DUF4436 family protein [Kutzneria albida]AHH95296.1 hypothetical protein KALB_1926 [Kutzneria albida DSM 43870]
MSEQEVKRRRWPYFVVPIGVVLAVGLGALGFFSEFSSRNVDYTIGDESHPGNAVNVLTTVQRVDAAPREMVLQVLVMPRGSYADNGNETAPAKDLVVETSSLTTAPLTFKAHERITARELRVPLNGVVSFFPFDRYTTQLYFGAETAGVPAPVLLTVSDHDPGFITRPTAQQTGDGEVTADLEVKRSRSTFFLAWFQGIVMWALGLSVLGGAVHIMRRKLGLVWPALGWMAATLFALVGFRNAAPGLPPIGSLIDYCAFFWAEAIITLSLVMVTLKGVRARAS